MRCILLLLLLLPIGIVLAQQTATVIEEDVEPTAGTYCEPVRERSIKFVRTTGDAWYCEDDGTPTWKLRPAGAAGAGGSDPQVQYNDSGSLNGAANLTYDDVTGYVIIKSDMTIGDGTDKTIRHTWDFATAAADTYVERTASLGVSYTGVNQAWKMKDTSSSTGAEYLDISPTCEITIGGEAGASTCTGTINFIRSTTFAGLPVFNGGIQIAGGFDISMLDSGASSTLTIDGEDGILHWPSVAAPSEEWGSLGTDLIGGDSDDIIVGQGGLRDGSLLSQSTIGTDSSGNLVAGTFGDTNFVNASTDPTLTLTGATNAATISLDDDVDEVLIGGADFAVAAGDIEINNTTDPSLTFQGSSAAAQLVFSNSADVIRATGGDFGIANTGSDPTLEFDGATNSANITLDDSADDLLFDTTIVAGGSSAEGFFGRINTRDGTDPDVEMWMNDTTIITDDPLPCLVYRGDDTGAVNTDDLYGASICAVAAADWGDGSSANDMPTRLEFRTQSDGTGDALGSSRFTIYSNGTAEFFDEVTLNDTGDPTLRFDGATDTATLLLDDSEDVLMIAAADFATTGTGSLPADGIFGQIAAIDGSDPQIDIWRDDSTIIDTEVIGSIVFRGDDSDITHTDAKFGGAIVAVSTGTWGDEGPFDPDDMPTEIEVYLQSSGTADNLVAPVATFQADGDFVVAGCLELPGGVTWCSGSGAPGGGCTSGSMFSRTDGTGPNLYVCQNSAWVSVGSAS